jgi:hypothetical protein
MTDNNGQARAQQSGSGTWLASIPGYRDEHFTCTPLDFVSNRQDVYIQVGGPTGGTSELRFILRFPVSIAHKTLFFGQSGAPQPPGLALIRGDDVTNYASRPNEGHITVEHFDLEAGSFRASGNFSFADHESGRLHQVVFDIDLTELQIVV